MEAARIKKEVGGRERERESSENSSARNFARRCSYVFAQSSTGTTMNVASKRLSRTSPAMVAKMYEALRVKSTF